MDNLTACCSSFLSMFCPYNTCSTLMLAFVSVAFALVVEILFRILFMKLIGFLLGLCVSLYFSGHLWEVQIFWNLTQLMCVYNIVGGASSWCVNCVRQVYSASFKLFPYLQPLSNTGKTPVANNPNSGYYNTKRLKQQKKEKKTKKKVAANPYALLLSEIRMPATKTNYPKLQYLQGDDRRIQWK